MPIQQAVEIMQDRASKHHVNITMVTLSAPVIATVPSGEFTQVLCNLLQNAIDASRTQDTIDIRVASQSDALTITVADHGPGIPSEVAQHIFEPFSTTKQGNQEGGMGLGLSISHSLVHSMGGELDFSTTIGQGTTFKITLPRTTT
jgi:two-component system NtrC family sensor kinase